MREREIEIEREREKESEREREGEREYKNLPREVDVIPQGVGCLLFINYEACKEFL